jgi:hypothetical protein
MPTQEIRVGTVKIVNGVRCDHTRPVQLEGEKLATHTVHIGSDGTRGATETLYHTADGRLIVHVENWSRQQTETTIYSMLEITEKDLRAGGRFEALGQGAWAWLRR